MYGKAAKTQQLQTNETIVRPKGEYLPTREKLVGNWTGLSPSELLKLANPKLDK